MWGPGPVTVNSVARPRIDLSGSYGRGGSGKPAGRSLRRLTAVLPPPPRHLSGQPGTVPVQGRPAAVKLRTVPAMAPSRESRSSDGNQGQVSASLRSPAELGSSDGARMRLALSVEEQAPSRLGVGPGPRNVQDRVAPAPHPFSSRRGQPGGRERQSVRGEFYEHRTVWRHLPSPTAEVRQRSCEEQSGKSGPSAWVRQSRFSSYNN